MYFVDLHVTALTHFGTEIKVDFYFYEFLSNEYRRGFVEMHFSLCDLIHKDKFFGAAMRQGKLRQPCPYPPGDYHMYNMSIPSVAIPPGFPFTKGRIYANATRGQDYVLCGHIDMELKEKLIRPGRKDKKSAVHNFFHN
ncbi:uncharacterized protein [Choristoneura fumiferana]|uniref:uncharacterized protein n=1 Tax=Choristoneura fumiferana TaxID=7141 RepID=UPI003D155DDB